MLTVLLLLFAIIILVPMALIVERFLIRPFRQETDPEKRSMVLRILSGVFLAAVVVLGLFIYKIEYEKRIIQTYDNGQHQLVIYQIGDPDFPFGKTDCLMVLKREGKQIDSIEFDVANDGKNLGSENFVVSWQDAGVFVTVFGEEQEDKTYALFYEEPNLYVLDDPQQLKANFISWEEGGFRAVVCDPMDNIIFPKGAELTVIFSQATYFVDLDGTVIRYDINRSIFEPSISSKLDWVEGMVILIEFNGYEQFVRDNGFRNLITGLRIENVDVISVGA